MPLIKMVLYGRYDINNLTLQNQVKTALDCFSQVVSSLSLAYDVPNQRL